jgi:hypothetical protein
MVGTTFFCPFCGNEGPENERVCSRCGRSIERWLDIPFEERLLQTLKHPIREYRMMAIQILGQRKYEHAVPTLKKLAASERDVSLVREIAMALMAIDSDESRRILASLCDHPSPVVRSVFDRERDQPGSEETQ